jgi:hypothetical protein
MKKTIIAYLCAVVALFSCKDKEEPDTDAPGIQISTPAPSSTVWRTINVQAEVTDEKTIKSIEIFIDGTSVKTLTNGTVNESVDTKSLEDGTHTLKIVAIDASGNKKEETLEFEVLNYFMKFSVGPSYVADGARMFFYISNEAGDVLGLQEVTNGEMVKFETPDNYAAGQTFVLNKFRHFKPSESSQENSLTTIQHVKAGSYNIQGFINVLPSVAGHSMITIDGFTGWNNMLLVSGDKYSTYDYEPLDQQSVVDVSLTGNDAKIFMNLNNNPQANPKYLLLEGVDVDENFDITYNELPEMTETRVDLGSEFSYPFSYTIGTQQAGDYNNMLFVSMHFADWFYNTLPGEVLYHTADDVFAEYIFYTSISKTGGIGLSHMITSSSAPTSFKELDANVVDYSYSEGQLNFKASGPAQVVSLFANESSFEENKYNYWDVILDPSVENQIKLVIPAELRTNFDFPNVEEIEFQSASFTDYNTFENFDDYLDYTFGTAASFYEEVSEYTTKGIPLATSGRQKPQTIVDSRKQLEQTQKRVEAQF